MTSMRVVPVDTLSTTLRVHVTTLINEIFASRLTGEIKHVHAARDQLRQFVCANFKAEEAENVRQE
jgi:hypothetical protein